MNLQLVLLVLSCVRCGENEENELQLYYSSCLWRPTLSCEGPEFLLGCGAVGRVQHGLREVRTPEEGDSLWKEMKKSEDIRGSIGDFGQPCEKDGPAGPHGKIICCVVKVEL